MGITMAVVASMEQEVSALKRLCPDECVPVYVTGVGKDRAMEGMVALLDARPTRPDCILSLGFAGALRDELKTGDLVLSQRLYATGEDTILESDASLLSLAQDVLDSSDTQRYSIANSLTVPQVVFGAAGKSRLGIATTSSVVNMEDYWIGQSAVLRGIAFLSVRAVLDTAKQELPPFVAELGDKGALNRALRIGANIVARPGYVPRLVKLVKQVKVAQESLARFGISFISRITTSGNYAICG
jgi:nucleoside phosphorylase